MQTFEVRLPGLGRGEPLLERYAHPKAGGRNESPPLQLDALPQGTQSLAFALVDRDAQDFVHWLVVNLPGEPVMLEEGASGRGLPGDATELRNSAQELGYFGPKPPPMTGEHRYEVVAYALDTPDIEMDPDAGFEEFRDVAEAHAVGKGDNYWVFGTKAR